MNRMKLTTLALATLLVAGITGQAVAEGDIIFTEPVMGVIFSHEVHVEENGMDCEECHDDLFEMEALTAQQNTDFTMQSLSEGNYCGACHDGDMAFDSDSRCASCHIGVIGYQKATGTAERSTHH